MILTYVPLKATINDNRKPEGGYYTAKCDVCGTEFFPKRSSAKYCNPKCAVTAFRKAKAEVLANGGTVKSNKKKSVNAKRPVKKLVEKSVEKPAPTVNTTIHKHYTFTTFKDIMYFMDKNFQIGTGQRNQMILELEDIEINNKYSFTSKNDEYVFEKVNNTKWTMTIQKLGK